MEDAIPKHIAIIMDGNGRWARSKNLSRVRGHEAGAERVREILEECGRIGVAYLTLYAFSSENWNRPKMEVDLLMLLLKRFSKSERDELIKKNVRLNLIGDIDRIPQSARKELMRTLEATSGNTGLVLTLALSYGGREEILRTIKRLAVSGVNLSELSESEFTKHLDTREMPDPDLVIRTSGEERLSNFLIWQAAYAELFFTTCYWPEFTKEILWEALRSYQKRERRYGGLSPSDQAGQGPRPLQKQK